MVGISGQSRQDSTFSIFNRPALDWFAYEVIVGFVALIYLAQRQSHASGLAVLRDFPIQELPALVGALALAQVPEYLRSRRWILGVLLTALGCASLDMGVILRVAHDQGGHLGIWQIWFGYVSAICAFILTAICVDVRGSQEEQAEIDREVEKRMAKLRKDHPGLQ
jgi:hypothetical protein